MDLSLIIIKTNDSQFERAINYIKIQSIFDRLEVIVLENKNNACFYSAAQALNYGASISKSDILVFMHQDVYLLDKFVLEKYYNYLVEHKNDIIGLAGSVGKKKTISDIYETNKMLKRSILTNGEVVKVNSVDECMFAMSKELWYKYNFDELVCNNWHCYAMDICFMNAIHGGNNFVLSGEAIHESIGNPNQIGFVKTIKKLVKKYRKTKLKRINGTCIDIRCNYLSFYIYFFRYLIKGILIKIGLYEFIRKKGGN